MICSKGCNLLQSIDLYLEKYNTLTYFKTQFFKFNDCFFTQMVLKVVNFYLGSFRIFIFVQNPYFFNSNVVGYIIFTSSFIFCFQVSLLERDQILSSSNKQTYIHRKYVASFFLPWERKQGHGQQTKYLEVNVLVNVC